MARDFLTTVTFDTPIDQDSVELEGQTELIRLVDVGERSFLLELLSDLRAGQRLHLRVRYRSGAVSEPVSFVLTSHPSEVDGRVEVHRPHLLEALQAELAAKDTELAALRARCAASTPADAVLSGVVDKNGVAASEFQFHALPDNKSGLNATRGMLYRAHGWTVITVQVRNLPGQESWAPTSARLLRADGTPVTVRQVRMDRSRLQADEEGLVAVEAGALVPSEGPFQLELEDTQGKRLIRLGGMDFRRTAR